MTNSKERRATLEMLDCIHANSLEILADFFHNNPECGYEITRTSKTIHIHLMYDELFENELRDISASITLIVGDPLLKTMFRSYTGGNSNAQYFDSKYSEEEDLVFFIDEQGRSYTHVFIETLWRQELNAFVEWINKATQRVPESNEEKEENA